jgi:hypothetical protein
MSEGLRPRLVLLRGGEAVAEWEIPPEGEWTLGRGADSPLPLEERSVSRRHASISCDAEGVRLVDLGTPNGTWVDGRPVKGSIHLRDGSLVRLGQSTNPDPLLLRFEDAGARLLAAMGLGPAAETPLPDSPTPAPEPQAPRLAREQAAASALPRERIILFDQRPPATTEPPSPPAVEEAVEAGETPLPPRRPGIPRQALVWAGLAFLFVMGLVWGLRSTQKPWQSVRVEPLRAASGARVALRGPEIEPSAELAVFVEDGKAEVVERSAGQLVFTVPELRAAEAGTRAVTLRVERKGIVLLRQSLQHETVPQIRAIEPTEAAVGDSVRLLGSGFASEPGRIEARVGQQPAAVLAASVQEIRLRVPVVTREATLEVPVELVIGGLASDPARLRVRPREAPCYPVAFEARSVAPRVWEIRHSFGPALFVEGPSPAEGTAAPPARVQQTVERLGEAFARGVGDAAVRFEVRGPALVALGLGPGPTEIARSGRAVASWVKEQAPELGQVELVQYWNAVVLNELLGVFAKRQPPRLLPEAEPARAALQRLQALSVETGGQGCPSAAEVETLTLAERDALERIALRVPARFGDVAGTWHGSLENVFSDDPEKPTLELRLELAQSGTSLSGRAFIYELRGPGIRWSPAPLEATSGRVRLGAGTEVELRFPSRPPYGLVLLRGSVSEDMLMGVFRSDRGREAPFALGYGPGE